MGGMLLILMVTEKDYLLQIAKKINCISGNLSELQKLLIALRTPSKLQRNPRVQWNPGLDYYSVTAQYQCLKIIQTYTRCIYKHYPFSTQKVSDMFSSVTLPQHTLAISCGHRHNLSLTPNNLTVGKVQKIYSVFFQLWLNSATLHIVSNHSIKKLLTYYFQ